MKKCNIGTPRSHGTCPRVWLGGQRDPPPREPLPKHAPTPSLGSSIPLSALPASQGMGPLPCKTFWRDPRASSMLLLMREVIVPPRLGPMSAEMGEAVSVTGLLQGPGACRKAGENTDTTSTPPSPTAQVGGNGDIPTLPPPASPFPERSLNWEKQQLEQSWSLEEPPDPAPLYIPVKASPMARRVCYHPQGRKVNPHNTPAAQESPTPEQLATGPRGCSSPSHRTPSPWRLWLA